MVVKIAVLIADDLYSNSDVGCVKATNFLGAPSTCEDCPFVNCVDQAEKGSAFARALRRDRGESMETWRQRASAFTWMIKKGDKSWR